MPKHIGGLSVWRHTVVGQSSVILQDSSLVDQSLFVHRDTHWRCNMFLELFHSQLPKKKIYMYIKNNHGVTENVLVVFVKITWGATV